MHLMLCLQTKMKDIHLRDMEKNSALWSFSIFHTSPLRTVGCSESMLDIYQRTYAKERKDKKKTLAPCQRTFYTQLKAFTKLSLIAFKIQIFIIFIPMKFHIK